MVARLMICDKPLATIMYCKYASWGLLYNATQHNSFVCDSQHDIINQFQYQLIKMTEIVNGV